jgi:hypothetical protein
MMVTQARPCFSALVVQAQDHNNALKEHRPTQVLNPGYNPGYNANFPIQHVRITPIFKTFLVSSDHPVYKGNRFYYRSPQEDHFQVKIPVIGHLSQSMLTEPLFLDGSFTQKMGLIIQSLTRFIRAEGSPLKTNGVYPGAANAAKHFEQYHLNILAKLKD